MTGYVHPDYAASLAEFGTPHQLPRSGGWILKRPIPDSPYHDAMSCYPLLVCQDWSQLPADLDEIGSELVSLSAVTDPFGEYDASDLHRCFKDMVIPFKEHFVVDLSQPINTLVTKHHRYYARKALRDVTVEICDDPGQYGDEWASLYATLTERHQLTGIRAFSRAAFAKQLRVPGLVMLQARAEGSIVGAHLWYVQGDMAYSHLSAFNLRGYELMASYALYWTALESFRGKVNWLNLGAGAGVQGEGTDGLSQFKQGWASGTKTAYFCGRIFDRARYAELMAARGISDSNYFPAYRQGEFG